MYLQSTGTKLNYSLTVDALLQNKKGFEARAQELQRHNNRKMAGIRAIVLLAFSAAAGITLLVLGCALPQFNNWWPMFVLTFYFLCPVPTFISRRYADSFESSSNAVVELCLFLTASIVASAYGLPVVLAHTPYGGPIIQWGACGLILAGNTTVFLTILGYFWIFSSEDGFDYSSW